MPRRMRASLSTGRKAWTFSAVAKAAKGDDAGGVVDEGDEGALSPRSPVAELGPVHDIAHPQLAGVAEGEAAPSWGLESNRPSRWNSRCTVHGARCTVEGARG